MDDICINVSGPFWGYSNPQAQAKSLDKNGDGRVCQSEVKETAMQSFQMVLNAAVDPIVIVGDKEINKRDYDCLQKLASDNQMELEDLLGYVVLKDGRVTGLTLYFILFVDGSPSHFFSDISALKGLTALEQLSLGPSKITDISALQGLTNLKDLYLANTDITDISALKGLTKLEKLNLGSTKVTDISVLVNLPGLEVLALRDLPISSTSIFETLPKLRELDLTDTHIAIDKAKQLQQKRPGLEVFLDTDIFTGEGIYFPQGFLPQKGATISVFSSQNLNILWKEGGMSLAPAKKEATFVFDCSGSMAKKFTKFKDSFLNSLSAFPDDIHYNLNIFGPDDLTKGSPAPPNLEVTKADKQALKTKMELSADQIKGATYLWANLEFSTKNTAKNGVVILYSDGRSDTSPAKKEGPEETDKKQRMEEIIKYAQENNIQIYLICGTKKAETHLIEFASMLPGQIHLFPAYNKDTETDMEKLLEILQTAASEQLLLPQQAYHSVVLTDANGGALETFRNGNPPASFGITAQMVYANGKVAKKANGELVIGDVTYTDKLGKVIKVNAENFEPAGEAAFIFSPVIEKVGSLTLPDQSQQQTISLVLDRSSSMLEENKINILKSASFKFCQDLLAEGGIKISINTFSGINGLTKIKKGEKKLAKAAKELSIELPPTSSLNSIKNTIESIVAYGDTSGWENLLLSMESSPQNGIMVVFSDGIFNGEKTAPYQVLNKALEKKIKVYFIGMGQVFSDYTAGKSYIPPENLTALEYLTQATQGDFIAISDVNELALAFQEIAEKIKQQPALSLSYPKAVGIKIPLLNKQTGEKIVLRIGIPQ